MYGLLWRALPGPRWVKALQSLVLFVAAVAFCFLWLFPRISEPIEQLLPYTDNTISTSEPSPAP